MKKLAIVLLLLLCSMCLLSACDLIPLPTTSNYTITSEKDTYEVAVGTTLDYKTLFTITDANGNKVTVTDAMISAPNADLTKEGFIFPVTCSYQGATKAIIIVVTANGSSGGGTTGGDSVGTHETIDLTSADNKVSASADKLAFAKGDLKVTIDKASSASDLVDKTADGYSARVYKGATVTVEYPKMTKIVINCDDYVSGGSTYYSGFDDMTVSGATITRDGTVVTITFESATDKFVSASVASQVRILSIEVFTSTGGSSSGGTTGGDSTGGDSTGGGTTGGGDSTGGDSTGGGSTGDQTSADLSDVFANYNDYDKWNFKLTFTADAEDEEVASEYAYTLVYFYDGYDLYYTDLNESFVDYVIYTDTTILYYFDNEDGTHTIFTEGTSDFEDYYNGLDFVDLTKLGDYEFAKNGDHYSAKVPSTAGNTILGEYEDCTYLTFDLYVANGKITKIVATQQDDNLNTTFTYTVELSNYGTVTVDVSDLDIDDSTGGDSTGGDSTSGGSTGSETQKDIVVTFQNSTGSATLNSTGDVKFTASSIASGWDESGDKRGIFFNKSSGNVTLTSTTTVNNVASVTVVVSENKGKESTVKVKVGSTVFTCDGKDGATFVSVKNSVFTFSTTTAVSGTVTIEIVPSVSSGTGIGSTYIQSIKLSATGTSSSGGGSTPTETMPSQKYDETKHEDNENLLFDAQNKYYQDENYFASTGLNPQGKYDVLVIPVEFSNDKFKDQELIDLESVFNNKANTGWESVSSYYNTSSYGKLDLTFNITQKVTLDRNYQSFDNGQDYGGDILKLALDALDGTIDFSKYDYNNDGFIDGIYIIYSAPIDYNGDYYWAYVTSYSEGLDDPEDTTKYDGKYPYTYLFASIDFMYESIETSEEDDYNSPIAGLKLNATTYIHETGHMLGLDDYYDYNAGTGSDQGLGGADMMDYTVGDHNAYSKLMLGWVNPTVITSTTTITISSFESSGQFIMVLLDYNGSYFSEYLIIDLYTATGLNALHAGVNGSLLYYNSNDTGAAFGARIYHVDSTIDTPYNDDYWSFTDNNNSITSDPLIKLVEADGDKNFESDIYNGSAYASENDLWQTGDVFSEIQPNYTRHDGKLVNFDISFDSVTADSATITITFNTAE